MAARRFSPRWLSTGVFAEEQICAGVPSGRLSFYEWQELQGLQRPKKAARSCLVVFLAAAAPSRREREKDHAAEIQRLQKRLEASPSLQLGSRVVESVPESHPAGSRRPEARPESWIKGGKRDCRRAGPQHLKVENLKKELRQGSCWQS